MEELIARALEVAGYGVAPTIENLRECFLDYVDSGVWRDLGLEDAEEGVRSGEITVKQICKALIRYCRW